MHLTRQSILTKEVIRELTGAGHGIWMQSQRRHVHSFYRFHSASCSPTLKENVAVIYIIYAALRGTWWKPWVRGGCTIYGSAMWGGSSEKLWKSSTWGMEGLRKNEQRDVRRRCSNAFFNTFRVGSGRSFRFGSSKMWCSNLSFKQRFHCRLNPQLLWENIYMFIVLETFYTCFHLLMELRSEHKKLN